MDVTTPDKALLKVLWDAVAANGRPAKVTFEELLARIRELHRVGVIIYPVGDDRALRSAVRADAELLAAWGLAEVAVDGAELTGAGELIGGSLSFPGWAHALMGGDDGQAASQIARSAN
jgi:hypothetical protein